MRIYLLSDQQEYTRIIIPWPIFHSPLTSDLRFFVQGRILNSISDSKLIFCMRKYLCYTNRNIQEPWPVFHGLLTSDLGQIFKVKIFVQGRILISVNGSMFIFHLRMHLYETSSTIQEPWPHDLYYMVGWLQTLANFPWLRFLWQVHSDVLLMVISWYFTRGFTSVRPTGSALIPRVHGSRICFHSKGSCPRVGLEINI